MAKKTQLSQFEKTLATRSQKLLSLLIQKNRAYGNSFDVAPQQLRILFPNGIKPDQYEAVLYITRVLDKLMRIATDNDAFGEDPSQDIAGYSQLRAAIQSLKKPRKKAVKRKTRVKKILLFNELARRQKKKKK